jgi:hypothetical protein
MEGKEIYILLMLALLALLTCPGKSCLPNSNRNAAYSQHKQDELGHVYARQER